MSSKISKSKGSSKNKTPTSKPAANGGLSWIIVLILLTIFFFAGVFIGSTFFEDLDSKPLDKLGLPGTNNKFVTWASNEINYLRHEIPNLHSSSNVHDSSTNYKKDEIIQTIKKQPAFLRSEPYKIPAKETTQDNKESTKPYIPSQSISTIDSTSHSSSSLFADEANFLIANKNLDNSNILVGAWINLKNDPIVDKNMRTVFSNKQPGCEAHSEQNGISLFINAWETSDHKLYLEYGGATSGCNKLSSGDFTLEPNNWYHVATFVGTQTNSLYINGEKVDSQSTSDPHIVQTNTQMLIGQYSESAGFPLFGNISQFVVFHNLEEANIDQTVKNMMDNTKIHDISGVVAWFPLDDISNKKGEARELIHGNSGKYHRSVSGFSVAGVKIKLVDRDTECTLSKEESDKLGRDRREKIKAGMKHAWDGYRKHAWGKDELKPLSNTGNNNWGGIGMTLLDSLDTLWIMGMKTEFYEATEWVRKSLTFGQAGSVSMFETTIRALGGLMAAYDLSGEKVFLDKAKSLGEKLAGAFDTESGIPTAQVNLNSGQGAHGWSGSNAILSELGTLQIEFRNLAYHTKIPRYETISMKPVQIMAHKRTNSGLYPIKVSIRDGAFTDSMITFGALGDSFYEYLLKVWIQGGKKETWLRDLYDRAMNGAIDKLLMTSAKTGLAFLSDWNGSRNYRKMDHLVCFMPGLLALGAYTDPNGIDSDRAKRDLAVAKALMYTCREMYHRTATGISPEYVEFPEHGDMQAGPNVAFYILRPETAESLFIMNQLTGDPIYREWAWEIWQAIDKNCKTGSGYASLRNVNNGREGVDDRMESFFLAETMKYLYLAQDPDNSIDLMKYVFNTEAHPTRIFDDSHTPVTL